MELTVLFESVSPAKLVKWKIKPGSFVNKTTILCFCELEENKKQLKIKCHHVGTVLQLKAAEGQVVNPGDVLLALEGCNHPTVMKDMCAECGADLRQESGQPGERKSTSSASVAMVHSIPELIVSQKEAQELGHEDEKRLLSNRKLVLLVDLDQTLLHTTNDNIPPNLKDAYHFQLWHKSSNVWYHTKFRPGTMSFLEAISELYELHICTFGARMYAHIIARFLDPEGKLFSHRILSRDECFNATSKTANLKALFPCGDQMVCIIDDREDVWGFAPNLIHVKPYIFFDGTADINAPIGLDQETWEGDGGKENGEQKKGVRDKKQGRQVKIVRVPKKKPEILPKGKDKKKDSLDKRERGSSEEIGIQQDKESMNSRLTQNVGGSDPKKLENRDKKNDSTEADSDQMDVTDVFDTNKSSCSEQIVKSVAEKDESSNSAIPQDTTCRQTDSVEHTTNDVQQQTGDASVNADCVENMDDDVNEQTGSVSDSTKGSVSEAGGSPPAASATTAKDEEEYDEMVEWEDTDDYLFYLEDILRRIHKAYFNCYDESLKHVKSPAEVNPPDIKTIVPYVKKKVLKGANLMFSGVIPNNRPPEKVQAYIVAKSLGAKIMTKFGVDGDEDGTVTHLVAARDRTEKVYEARKRKNVHIVNPDWIWSCAYRWEWVDERLFPLNDSMEGGPRDSPKPLPKPIAKTKGAMNEADGVGGALESRRFSDSYNPFFAFSKDDLDNMDKEVGDLMGDGDEDNDYDDEDSDDEAKIEDEIRRKVLGIGKPLTDSSSDEDSLSGDFPKGWDTRKRKRSLNGDTEDFDKDVDDDCDLERDRKLFRLDDDDVETDGDSVGSVDEEIAAAVERELLDF